MYSITALSFSDNYIWAIHTQQKCIIVDPGDSNIVLNFIQQKSLELIGILITHHHADHIAGLIDCLEAFPNIPVYGSALMRVPAITHPVKQGDTFKISLNNLNCSVFESPGHTLDDLSFLIDKKHLFVGDTLFSAGCGRIFEGNSETMYESIQKLMALDEEILIYCGHEYTLSNLEFGLSILADDPEMLKQLSKVKKLRDKGQASLPSKISVEKKINLFCRCHEPILIKALEIISQKNIQSPQEAFRLLRQLKNRF